MAKKKKDLFAAFGNESQRLAKKEVPKPEPKIEKEKEVPTSEPKAEKVKEVPKQEPKAEKVKDTPKQEPKAEKVKDTPKQEPKAEKVKKSAPKGEKVKDTPKSEPKPGKDSRKNIKIENSTWKKLNRIKSSLIETQDTSLTYAKIISMLCDKYESEL